MGSSKEGSYPVTVSYLEDDGFLISNETATVTGINDFYEFHIPAGAVFLRIDGLQANDTALYIYEIEKWRSPWTEDNPYHYNANNFKDAYDKVDTTSANIFSQNGFIKYLLSDMGLQDDMDIQMLMAGSEKGSYNMIVEFFLADGSDIPREIITVSELKLAYRLHVPSGATHIKIWGVDADKTALYIYEIQKWEADLPVDLPFYQANNITHAYDGSESTSANIFTEDGYILFTLSDMGLAAGDKAVFIMNGAEGNTQDVKVEALDSDKNVLESIGIPITGFKNRYAYLIPPGTTYLRFYGMALEPLYIYEIMKWVDDISADNPYHANADHFRDAYDNNDVTSANIFSANGFIKYSLDTIGLSGVTKLQIIMCTTNDISPATPEVVIEFFDTDHAYMPGVRQTVSHVKNAYAFDIPAGAAYVKIWGVDNTVLCLFEIEKWTNVNLFHLNANNFGDAYDGNDSSSANIFSGGYIVYKLSDIGVTADTTIKFMMNTIYGDIRAVVVSSLDSDMQALGTTTINLEKGFKKLYDFTVAANAEYLKIEGPGDTDLYIYEIIK